MAFVYHILKKTRLVLDRFHDSSKTTQDFSGFLFFRLCHLFAVFWTIVDDFGPLLDDFPFLFAIVCQAYLLTFKILPIIIGKFGKFYRLTSPSYN
jgi:hypothetical protein